MTATETFNLLEPYQIAEETFVIPWATNPLHSRTIQNDVRRKNFSIRLRGVH